MHAVTLAVVLTAAASGGQETIPWDQVPPREQAAVERYLAAEDWPIRVFGLMRLERYSGPAVESMVREGLRAKSWSVRCFALRQAARMGIAVEPATFANETVPFVIRAALRHGVALDPAKVETVVQRLLKTRNVEALLSGLEIAAASDIETLRAEAAKRVEVVVRNMDPQTEAIVQQRLGRLLDLDPAPKSLREWHLWLQAAGAVVLPPPDATHATSGPPPLVSTMEYEPFNRLWDYLGVLRKRDLDMAVVMDSTSSMIPMINEARVGVDSLILFFNDISRTMRLAFVAYRDHDNPPVWQGHPFTTNVESIREFLFGIRITGGADLPEAVLEGLQACRELDWNPRATRQIILVGDARPHDEDLYDTLRLAEWYIRNGVTVHAVHIPQEVRRDAGPGYRDRVAEHTKRTEVAFSNIAESGGGRLVKLTNANQLVPSIMHVTIEEGWWPVFDEFYALYQELCR
ncbi:MAG: vWA domain-containing protein [Planctomycetota bacterium]|jgi:Mg-chelatase subunit ChlD